jgi:uncharacterized membrane protein YGL010W
VAFTVPERMQARLRDYDTFHTQRSNELCHWFGIPSIIAGTASLLGAVTIVEGYSLSLAEIVLAVIFAYYVIEARALGLATSIAMALIAAAGRAVPPIGGLGFFLVGWGLQLIGHSVYEKNSPAFLRNLTHLLVGPAWLVERGLRPLVRWELRSPPPR